MTSIIFHSISDTQPPVIQCPDVVKINDVLTSISRFGHPLQAEHFLNATDNVKVVNISCASAFGILSDVAEAKVVCRAIDSSWNDDNCTFPMDVKGVHIHLLSSLRAPKWVHCLFLFPLVLGKM